MRVADFIANALYDAGARHVFLLSGGGMMHLLDAVARRSGLSYVCQHHEQACAMAADSYSRVSGRVGVCYGTSGPGATNLLTGIVGAWQDSTAAVFITGQSKTSQTIHGSGSPGLRQFGTFEVDIVPIVRSVTKYAAVIDKAADVRYHLERALHEARAGRPGPVLLDVPIDVQGALVEPDELVAFESPPPVASQFSSGGLDDVVERLGQAQRPIVLAGHGVRVSGAADAFRAVVEKIGVPVVTTQLAKDLLPYEHPLWVGHPGVKGDRAGNFAVTSADFILAIGTSLHVLTTGYELKDFAPTAYVVHVDPDPAVHQRQQIRIDLGVVADVHQFLRELESGTPSLAMSTGADWLKRCRTWKTEHAVIDEPHVRVPGKVHYYDFVHELSSQCSANDVIITDAGSAFYVVGQAFRSKAGQRVIVSGSLGSMGFGLPAATGAAFAAPTRRVVCVTGDGSLQTNVHELGVLAHNCLNVKLFVMNNGGYVSIRATQRSYFDGYEAGVDENTGVALPDLRALASAYGLSYQRISTPDELSRGITQALDASGPLLVEVLTSPDEIVPTVSSSRLPDGTMVSRPLNDMAPFMTEEERGRCLPPPL